MLIRTPPFAETWQAPQRREYIGQFVTLSPLDPQRDHEELFTASHIPESYQSLWTYMWHGPFANRDTMLEWLLSIYQQEDPLFFSVQHHESGQKVGMISILNIVPAAGRAELGHIWYSPAVQKTRVNTEATYLLLRYLFEELSYRRVEWKCDNRNENSKRAAQRMGFAYEGLFRQHLVVKGRNRDTAWFSMLDHEWEPRKANFERWLTSDEPLSLTELNAALIAPENP